jgi:hypothetical protein
MQLGRNHLTWSIDGVLTTRVSDLDTKVSKAAISSLPFINIAYGGLHASGWNHFFSSWQEQLLWRISSVVVMAAGVLIPLCWLCADWPQRWFPDRPPDWHPPQRRRWVRNILVFLGISIGVVLGLVAGCVLAAVIYGYCACRLFLVVEAFIGLRELPADVYITPSWSQLLPHL